MDLSCSKYSGSRRRRREGKKRNSIMSSKDRRLEGRETRIKNSLSLTVPINADGGVILEIAA
jgi:hypothetical protein